MSSDSLGERKRAQPALYSSYLLAVLFTRASETAFCRAVGALAGVERPWWGLSKIGNVQANSSAHPQHYCSCQAEHSARTTIPLSFSHFFSIYFYFFYFFEIFFIFFATIASTPTRSSSRQKVRESCVSLPSAGIVGKHWYAIPRRKLLSEGRRDRVRVQARFRDGMKREIWSTGLLHRIYRPVTLYCLIGETRSLEVVCML